MTKKKILIATGGTGGHIFPAYSLANYLLNKNFRVDITTDGRGFQFLKDYKNLNIVKIPSSPLIKKNIIYLFFSTVIIIFSIIRSFLFLLFHRPSIIFGMGGYSSFPLCIAATILRIKFIIYENNLIIGKANKFLLPFAKKIFVSFEELEGISSKYKYKIKEIGNIVRQEIIDSNEIEKADKELQSFDKLKILVLGGSQAAKIFAEEIPQILVKLNHKFSLKIYQQCQKSQTGSLSNFYKKANINHEIFNFTDKIVNYYLKANLVITRSGASVLGELINIKIPFISIPLPTSSDNHQHKNAEFYQKKGYGYLLLEKDMKYKLYDLISSIFKDKKLLKNILSNQSQYSDKETLRKLDIELIKVLNEKN